VPHRQSDDPKGDTQAHPLPVAMPRLASALGGKTPPWRLTFGLQLFFQPTVHPLPAFGFHIQLHLPQPAGSVSELIAFLSARGFVLLA